MVCSGVQFEVEAFVDIFLGLNERRHSSILSSWSFANVVTWVNENGRRA